MLKVYDAVSKLEQPEFCMLRLLMQTQAEGESYNKNLMSAAVFINVTAKNTWRQVRKTASNFTDVCVYIYTPLIFIILYQQIHFTQFYQFLQTKNKASLLFQKRMLMPMEIQTKKIMLVYLYEIYWILRHSKVSVIYDRFSSHIRKWSNLIL